jgi:DNA gyrase subunit A
VEEHGDERRTVILEDGEEDEAPVEQTLADEDVVVAVSHEGFVKRMPMHLYRRRISSGKALSGMERYEEDYLEWIFTARTRGWILAFSEQGQGYFLPVLDVPESGRSSRGQSIYSLVSGADRGDPIVSMLPVDDLGAADRFLVFLSRKGVVKRTPLSDFSNPRVGGVKAAGLKKGDRILEVALSDGTSEVMLLSRGGRAIRFPESEIAVVGRTAQGVKGMGLRGDDEVVGMLLIRRASTVLTVTEQGMGKRTPVDDFPLQKRGGLGTLAVPSGGEGANVVCALEVLESDQIVVVTAGGQVSHVDAEAVSVQGRRTQGRRIVKLATGDRVVEVTRGEGRDGAPAPGPLGDDDGQLDLLGS